MNPISRKNILYLLGAMTSLLFAVNDVVQPLTTYTCLLKGDNDMSTQINVSNSVNLAERLKFAKEADALARQNSFIDYRSRRARNTLRRQDAELVNFGVYVGNDDLATNPRAWEGISLLATKAGIISTQEHAMIRIVSGYSHKEGQRIDEQREVADIETRMGDKKVGFLVLSMDQEVVLKAGCDSKPYGLRDRVLLVLLLDLGLRVSEVADLQADDFNSETGMLEVHRCKTDTTTTFELQNDKVKTIREYFESQFK